MLDLLFFVFAEAQVIGAHQASQQKHRGKLDANQIRTKQGYPDFLRFHGASGQARGPDPHQVKDLYNKDAGEKHRASPDSRREPLFFHLDALFPQVEHHHHEDKKHHDRTRVNDHLKRCHKWGAERVENHCHCEEGHNQVQQGMHNIQASQHQKRRYDRHYSRDVKSKFHNQSHGNRE